MLPCLQERATSSNWQTAFNAINVLCGVGLLTTPYAMAITGTSALLLLVFIGECCHS
jgi:amino acid permease